MTPRLLDLFCGAGGAAMGYHRAGFEVVGVDVKPQPHYPFQFIQADAMDYLDGYLRAALTAFDAIHASPPCQDHSALRTSAGLHGTGWMLNATLDRLREQSTPWIVENVVGAPLPTQATLDGRYGVMLCGTSFGLGVSGLDLPRHRLFESSIPISGPACCCGQRDTMGVYGHGLNSDARRRLGRDITADEQRLAMDIDWMTRDELAQAIPPAYTALLGSQLMNSILDRSVL